MNPSVRRRKALISGALDLITVVFVFVLIFPIIWLFLTAIKTPGEMFGDPYKLIPTSVTSDNFQRIWSSAGFQDAFKNSVIVAAATAIIVTTVAFCAAFSLSRFRYGLNGAFANTILAVQMIPGIVLVVPLIGTLRRVHLTDSLLGLILTYLLIGLPIAVWMLKGYLDDIPRDLDEAALVDGASSTQVLRQILLPLMAASSRPCRGHWYRAAVRKHWLRMATTRAVGRRRPNLPPQASRLNSSPPGNRPLKQPPMRAIMI